MEIKCLLARLCLWVFEIINNLLLLIISEICLRLTFCFEKDSDVPLPLFHRSVPPKIACISGVFSAIAIAVCSWVIEKGFLLTEGIRAQHLEHGWQKGVMQNSAVVLGGWQKAENRRNSSLERNQFKWEQNVFIFVPSFCKGCGDS